MEATLQTTHRFMQIDDLATGQTFVCEMCAEDAARVYTTEHQTLLALGHTIRIDNKLHLDLQAFVRVNRTLPQAMTRPPRPATVGSAAPQPVGQALTVASDDDTIARVLGSLPLAANLPGTRPGRVMGGRA